MYGFQVEKIFSVKNTKYHVKIWQQQIFARSIKITTCEDEDASIYFYVFQICVLNILLPEEIIPVDFTLPVYQTKQIAKEIVSEETSIHTTYEEVENKWPDKLTDEKYDWTYL